MEEIFNQAQEFMNQNPHYGYLIGAVFCLVISIGNFMQWDWALSPADTQQRYWMGKLGKKAFGKVMGVLGIIGFIACLICFYFSIQQ